MALTPQQKALRELEGDAPELVAWGLMEWIRLVDQVNNRAALLSAFAESLKSVNEGVSASAAEAGERANGTQRRLAFKLVHLIAEMEGREYGQRNQGDRAWILATFTECLETVMGRRVVVVEPVVAGADVAAAG